MNIDIKDIPVEDVLKDIEAIIKEMADLNMFSDRQQDVLIGLLEDKSNSQIAIDLGLTRGYINDCVKAIRKKIIKYYAKTRLDLNK